MSSVPAIRRGDGRCDHGGRRRGLVVLAWNVVPTRTDLRVRKVRPITSAIGSAAVERPVEAGRIETSSGSSTSSGPFDVQVTRRLRWGEKVPHGRPYEEALTAWLPARESPARRRWEGGRSRPGETAAGSRVRLELAAQTMSPTPEALPYDDGRLGPPR